jgi:hypothetical protein
MSEGHDPLSARLSRSAAMDQRLAADVCLPHDPHFVSRRFLSQKPQFKNLLTLSGNIALTQR